MAALPLPMTMMMMMLTLAWAKGGTDPCLVPYHDPYPGPGRPVFYWFDMVLTAGRYWADRDWTQQQQQRVVVVVVHGCFGGSYRHRKGCWLCCCQRLCHCGGGAAAAAAARVDMEGDGCGWSCGVCK